MFKYTDALLRVSNDFKITHFILLSKGIEYPIVTLANMFFDSLCILPFPYFDFPWKTEDILYVNSLLFKGKNLTAMINEVKSPCSGIDSNGLHFHVVKNFPSAGSQRNVFPKCLLLLWSLHNSHPKTKQTRILHSTF